METKLNFKNFEDLCYLESTHQTISFHRRIKFLLRKKESSTNFILSNADNLFKKRLLSKIRFQSHSCKELNLYLFRLNKDYVIDQLFFDYLDKKITEKKFIEFYKLSKTFRKKNIPINGNDLIKIGFEPGKIMRKTLDKLELFWVEKNFECTRKDCIKFVKNFLP